MNTATTAGGVVPIVNMFDYLQPDINRPDLYYQQAYPIQGGGGGNTRSLTRSGGGATQSIQRDTANGQERSPNVSLYYTIGLIVLSAAIFLTLAAWSNVLLSWFDSIYVSPVVSAVTTSRLYFALTLTIISIIVITILLLLWYYFTLQKNM